MTRSKRDPLHIRLEGSNDGSPTWESGNWEVIYENEMVPDWPTLFPDGDRFKTQAFTFDNTKLQALPLDDTGCARWQSEQHADRRSRIVRRSASG